MPLRRNEEAQWSRAQPLRVAYTTYTNHTNFANLANLAARK